MVSRVSRLVVLIDHNSSLLNCLVSIDVINHKLIKLIRRYEWGNEKKIKKWRVEALIQTQKGSFLKYVTTTEKLWSIKYWTPKMSNTSFDLIMIRIEFTIVIKMLTTKCWCTKPNDEHSQEL